MDNINPRLIELAYNRHDYNLDQNLNDEAEFKAYLAGENNRKWLLVVDGAFKQYANYEEFLANHPKSANVSVYYNKLAAENERIVRRFADIECTMKLLLKEHRSIMEKLAKLESRGISIDFD